MSQFVATEGAYSPEYVIPPATVDPGAVTLGEGSKKVAAALGFTGIVGIIVTLVVAISGGPDMARALTSYVVGFAVAVALGLGSLGYVMIFQQFNAGWTSTLRRVLEIVASCLPFCLILFLPILIWAGDIYHWIHALKGGEELALKKAPYLSVSSWVLRTVFYFALWGFLGWKLLGYSRQQDQTGDKWLTAKARRLSAPGLLLFALSLAFASFDWLMGLDYHWFSTMFGVYYFAGAMQAATALTILILGFIRLRGKLGGLITEEHFHDLGKLLLSFTVFWAYIGFSQYFLIWYANLPEETMWFNVRAENGWEKVGFVLVFGRFLIPFLFLLWKDTKRKLPLIMLVAAWQFCMEIVDIFYVARPAATPHGVHFGFVDVAGIVGPLFVFLGFVVWRLGSMPIVPIRDPRLYEALHHKNYV